MRISRIFVDQGLEPGRVITLDGSAGHYLSKVLRLRKGDPLVVFNGDGSDYAAELLTSHRNAPELMINTRLPAAPESGLKITLVQAVSRGERMDYSLQKSTELGVAAIQPVMTERVEVRLDEKRLVKRMAHWRGVIIAACEQSGRAMVPELFSPLTLDEWTGLQSEAVRLVLDPVSDQSLSAQLFGDRAVEMLVGPEGGLSEQEMKRLAIAAVRPVSLGPRTLRTETSGPAAIAVLQAVAGDF